ncbi:MAG TPA: hypothetical protein PK854_07750 [Oscillospiraceae bacterium]|nr:hypothetical protein [Oscillospiraceae bacterium]HPS35145.1 hypothetical protein [Oscillospiraceae bacterium]
MIIKEQFEQAANRLFEFCPYPAVRYKSLFQLLDRPYDDLDLVKLRPEFLTSDIVEDLCRTQAPNGGWGRLYAKDYSAKDKIPTSTVGINRALYIGLTLEDRDILLCAQDYLEDFLNGTPPERPHETNERAKPWRTAHICELLESIRPYNDLCDQTYIEWLHIASRAYQSGEYSYERDAAAQHEVFWTREKRIIPIQAGLLMKRPKEVPPKLEEAMLCHLGGKAYEHGYFWPNCPAKLPEHFVCNKTRRWMYAFNYINQFRGSALYLSDTVRWLLENQNADGLWDWGTQTKDPWGYFGYLSMSRNRVHNRIVDCSMEILNFLNDYIKKNKL